MRVSLIAICLVAAHTAWANVLIVGKQSNRCVDVNNGDTRSGTQIWIFGCNQNNRNQVFKDFNVSDSGLRLSAAPAKCLHVNGQLTQGTPVVTATCDGSAKQKWKVPTGTGPVTLLSYPNLCLDVYAKKTGDYSKVIVGTCNGGTNQQWTLKQLVTTPVPTTKAPVPTTTVPVPTTKAPVPTTAVPVPTTKAPVPTTTVPVPTTTVPVPTTTIPATTVPTTTVPVPTTTVPVPTTTVPVPTTTVPVPITTVPVPITTVPVPTTTVPVLTTTVPVPTATVPVPTTKAPCGTGDESCSATFQVFPGSGGAGSIPGVIIVSFPANSFTDITTVTLSLGADSEVQDAYAETSGFFLPIARGAQFIKIDVGKKQPRLQPTVELFVPVEVANGATPTDNAHLMFANYYEGEDEVLLTMELTDARASASVNTTVSSLLDYEAFYSTDGFSFVSYVLPVLTASSSNSRRKLLATANRRLQQSTTVGNCAGAALQRPMTKLVVSSPFGSREIDLKDASTFHRAIDFATPEGTPVFAAHAGKVEVLINGGGLSEGYGKYVIIRGPKGIGTTLYGHLTADSVKFVNGDTVKAGDIIALSGNTGNTDGAHLHFEYAPDGEISYNRPLSKVDPTPCFVNPKCKEVLGFDPLPNGFTESCASKGWPEAVKRRIIRGLTRDEYIALDPSGCGSFGTFPGFNSFQIAYNKAEGSCKDRKVAVPIQPPGATKFEDGKIIAYDYVYPDCPIVPECSWGWSPCEILCNREPCRPPSVFSPPGAYTKCDCTGADLPCIKLPTVLLP